MSILADIKHLLHTIILFQCFLLGFYLISRNGSRIKSNRFLAAFLFSKGLSEFDGIFRFFREVRRFIFYNCPQLFYIPFIFHFLYVPLLFLYVLTRTQKDFQFKKNHLLHGLPFILIFVYVFANYLIQSSGNLRVLLNDGYRFNHMENIIFSLIADIQFFIYAVVSLRLLYIFRKRLKDSYSTINRIDLSWLRFVLYGFITWRSLGILQTILYIYLRNECLILIYIASLVIFLVFVSIIVFRGLAYPQIFSGHENHFMDKVVLPKDLVKKYLSKLETYMQSEKPYMNSELSLEDLSAMTAIPSRHLSKVLNNELNQNFFDFINRYRVEEAKKLLKAPHYQMYTILAIAFEAGFNSKSTFNSLFKKYVNMTPSQFQKAEEI